MKQIIALILLVFCFQFAQAQQPDFIRGAGDRIKSIGGSTSGGGKDTIGFVHRDDKKDSISITYKYLDSIRSIPFDSSINDFDKYFITRLSTLVTSSTREFEKYEYAGVMDQTEQFFWFLFCDNYLEITKTRAYDVENKDA